MTTEIVVQQIGPLSFLINTPLIGAADFVERALSTIQGARVTKNEAFRISGEHESDEAEVTTAFAIIFSNTTPDSTVITLEVRNEDSASMRNQVRDTIGSAICSEYNPEMQVNASENLGDTETVSSRRYDKNFIAWLRKVFEESLESSLYTRNGGDYILSWFLEGKVSARARQGHGEPQLNPFEIVAISQLIEQFGVNDGLQAVSESKDLDALKSKLKTGPKKVTRSAERKTGGLPRGDSGPVVNYTVLSSFETSGLISLVRNALTQGYEPIGGVSVAVRHDPRVQVLFSQAMVLRD